MPAGLKDSSFKYALYNGSTSIITGSFSSYNQGGTITLLNNQSVSTITTMYTLYIWLDGTMSNPNSTQNQSFSFSLRGTGSGANTIQNLIPSDYTEVEYIESTGTQYIDTGFIPNINSKIDVTFKITQWNSSGYGAIFGTRNSSSGTSNGFANSYTSSISYIMNGIETSTASYALNQKYNISLSKNGFYKNGIIIKSSFSGTVDCIYSLLLFARNRNDGAGSLGYLQMYYAKIYDNGTLVRNFIPVIRNSNSIAGMYDTVYNQFYPSAVTNSNFVAS